MFVTHSFQIPYEKHLYDGLRSTCKEKLRLFGMILYERRIPIISPLKSGSAKQRFRQSENKHNLHSQTVQAIADKYTANRETIRKLHLTDKKAKYP